MKITELTGREVKKHLKLKYASFQYHNKKSYRASFGFFIRDLNDQAYLLHGEYFKSSDDGAENIFDGLISSLQLDVGYRYKNIELITENIIDCRALTLETILNRMIEKINAKEWLNEKSA